MSDSGVSGERLSLEDFHGHMGPYLYVGYRMGALALKMLKSRGKALRALARCGTKPPVSCLIDGIQFSACCTLGKGNISVAEGGVAEAVFEGAGEGPLTIRLRESVRGMIDSEKAIDALVGALMGKSDEELFEVG